MTVVGVTRRAQASSSWLCSVFRSWIGRSSKIGLSQARRRSTLEYHARTCGRSFSSCLRSRSTSLARCLRMPLHFQDRTPRCHHENTHNNTMTTTHTNQSNKQSIRYHHGTNRINPRRTPNKQQQAEIIIRLSPPAKQMNQPIAKLQLLDVTIPHPHPHPHPQPSVPTN